LCISDLQSHTTAKGLKLGRLPAVLPAGPPTRTEFLRNSA
jgi:hypothetical protein